MKAIVCNNTTDTYSFVNATVSIPPGNTEVLAADVFPLYSDFDFITNLKNQNLYVSDGFTSFYCDEAVKHMQSVADFVARDVRGAMLATTQFEKRDKTLKLVSGSAPVDGATGQAVVKIQVPGTPNPTADELLAGRWISSGLAFFDTQDWGDKILGVHFTDEDNITGQGAGTVIGSYTDDEAPQANQGWFIPKIKGQILAEALGGYGFCPAGFYLKVVGQKATGAFTGNFYVNIEWGEDNS